MRNLCLVTRAGSGHQLNPGISRLFRVAGTVLSTAAALLLAASANGQPVRLHTSSALTPPSVPFIVPFDSAGQPLPPIQGTLPAGFTAIWQLPASPQPFSLRLYPAVSYAFVGAAADEAVEISSEARTVLQNGGFLDSAGNWSAGSSRSVVSSATTVREGRYLLALDSSSKNAIAVIEIGVENGRPSIRSAHVKTGASLAGETWGVLGAGITIAPDLSRGTVVFGDATSTYAFLYSPGATGNRFSPIDTIPSPPGFRYIAATSAGQDGAFWVVGVNGGTYEVRFLDAKTRAYDAPVATIVRSSGDALIPAFDPYDAGRMLLVVSKVGSTPVYVLTDLARGVGKGILAPSSSNGAFDFSASPTLTPAVLAPVGLTGRGYVLGRSGGESSERLYAIDLVTGGLSNTSIVFGTARHQALLLERPDRAPQSLSIKADITGTVFGGDTATFTVTRTDSSGAFVVRYAAQSPDGSAVAGRDYDAGSGSVSMAAGSTTAKISIPIIAVDGCASERTFGVTLTNTDASLVAPAEAQQVIASSSNCTYGLVGPTVPVTAGQALTFTATRTGTYLVGAVPVPWTAAPGNSSTSPADFSPAASIVTIPPGAASSTFRIDTPTTTLDCVSEKAVRVTITPPEKPSASATGRIAAVTSGCTVQATVTAPEKPYLPGDEVVIALSEVNAGRFDLSKATWVVTALGNTTYEKVAPTGSQGSSLTLRFQGATAVEAAGSVKVDYSVPVLSGAPAPATGTVTLDRVASYPDLVRMDGPSNYSIPAGARRRYSLVWGGGTRRTTWLNPGAGGAGSKKELRWSYWRGASPEYVACPLPIGEDCSFAFPETGDVTKVLAEVLVGSSRYAAVAEIAVKGVPAPASTAFETVRYVPVALEFAGIPPTFFETELTLVNGSAGTVEAELKWLGITQKEIVGAGRQVVLNGLVESLRETNPGQSGGIGSLKVTFRGLANESEKRLVGVMVRTTTPAGAPNLYRRTGRAGLAYRGVLREELFGGAAGQSKSAWLIGLRGTSNMASGSVDRTNLAVVKPDPSDPNGVVDVELYGNGGNLLTTLANQSVTDTFTQWSNLAAVAGGPEVGYARVVWKSGGPVTTYATPVNNVSGDGSWVFPVRQEDAGAEKTDALLAPVLFELPDGGAGNFRYVADAALTSTGGATNTALDYYWTSGSQSGTTSLARGVQGQAILGATQTPGIKALGVVEELRKGTGSAIPAQTQGQLVIGLGLVRRQDNQAFIPGTLMAGTRVDGPTAGDPDASKYGRFGIYLPAIPLRDLKGTRLAELRVLGLRQDAWVRSNLALINPGAVPVTLKLQLAVTKADGRATTVLPTAACGTVPMTSGVVTVPARTFCQIGNVLNAADATSGYAILARTGADASNDTKPFYAYGVVNDGFDSSRGTSDGAYLLAELASASAVSGEGGGSGGGPGGGGTGSCSFVINNAQGARISYDPATQRYDAASGQPLTFVASGVTSSVDWNFGNGQTASGNPSTYTYYVTQASSYTVSMTSATCSVSYGIDISPSAAALSFTVVDAATGTPLASPTGVWQASAGQSLRFIASGATGAVSWSFGDGETSVEASPIKTYGPLVDTTYTVTVTSGGLSKQGHIAVKGSTGAPLTGNFSFRYSDGTTVNRTAVQPNKAIVFTGADQATTYTWDFGDGSALAGGSPKEHTFTRGGSFTVRLTVARSGVPGTVTTALPPVFTVLPPPDPLLWVAAGMVYAEGGNGALWQSDLSIHNPGTQAGTVSLAFVSGAGWEGVSNATWLTLGIGPGETRAFSNVLGGFFSLSKGSWGVVLVRGDDVPAPPVIVTRTYDSANAATAGTVGLSVPVVSVAAGVKPQSAQGANFLAGLRHDIGFRTNLTVANLKDETAEVEIIFRDASGVVLGSPAKITVEARGVKQLNSALSAEVATGDTPIGGAGWGDPVSHFSAEVKLIRGTGVYPYATVIDQASGDSFVVTPIPRPSAAYRLPGIVRVKGKADAYWLSDIAILNPSAVARRVRISLSYIRTGTTRRIDASQSVVLHPYELLVGVDFVRMWLGLSEDDPNGYASSYVDVSPAPDDPAPTEPLVVNGRTYASSGAGSIGLQIDPFILEDGVSEQGARRKLVLTGLEANARYRTNVALLLTPGSAGNLQVDLRVLDSFGREVKKLAFIGLDASNPLVQLNSSELFAGLSTTESSRATVVIDSPRGSAFVGAYATIIDNLSEDATFVAGQPAP